MRLAKLTLFISVIALSKAIAFGPSAKDIEIMKRHKELCEIHLKSICGEDLEFPDTEKLSPSLGMFKKISRIKKCIKSDEVQKSDIPSDCKKDIGPGAK
jgi:hypothetical protein